MKKVVRVRTRGWDGAALSAHFDYYPQIPPGSVTHPSCRAEPILARIQEDRTVFVSPVFDNILFDTFELIKYALAVDGFNWELWCRYDALPKAWVDLHDVTAPVRSVCMSSGNLISLGEVRDEWSGLCLFLVVVLGVG